LRAATPSETLPRVPTNPIVVASSQIFATSGPLSETLGETDHKKSSTAEFSELELSN
jgi:hypothetical protein